MSVAAIFSISLILLIVATFVLVVGIAFSKDEFQNRNSWKKIDLATGKLAWRHIDAGRFALFFLVRCWFLLLVIVIVSYIILPGERNV